MWASDIHVLIREGSHTQRITDLLDTVSIHTFSLENKDETQKIIGEIRPQIVFHVAAAGTAVGRIPFTLDELIQANTLGTIHLIDAASEAGCECFIQTWSSSEYGQKDLPMHESDILEPNNLYGLSKAWATQYATYLGKDRNFPIVTYRIFSAYGPYEDAKRLIPTLLQSYVSKIPPKLSSPYSVRDFIYIDDIVSAYLEADRAITVPWDIINLWTGNQYSIEEVIEILQEIFDTSLSPEYGEIPRNQKEPKCWVSDNSKMKTLLGITPISLRSWLESTLYWMQKSL